MHNLDFTKAAFKYDILFDYREHTNLLLFATVLRKELGQNWKVTLRSPSQDLRAQPWYCRPAFRTTSDGPGALTRTLSAFWENNDG